MVVGADGRPTICLNLIVKNESHVIHELFESVAPYIDYWVIVDTGSTDGTQDLIRREMDRLGIPGELHERPWRDFGHNRSEAITLAQGHCDYIWVMDADDVLVGQPEFRNMTADTYLMLIDDGVLYWRRQVFRDGVPWRYQGVLHELAVCDVPTTEERLGGDFRVLSRRIGGRNLDPDKYRRDAEILLAEVERNPDDPRSVFYLAQSYYCYGDWENSRKWDQRRAEMGGWAEEVYYSSFRAAEAMASNNEPWPEVQDAYLRAWNMRPTRAEALHSLARHHRIAGRYALGHLFAEKAASLPLPDDVLFVNGSVHTWRALDEQAVCASWIGRQEEAFLISRRLVAVPDVPDDDRTRIAANRDLMTPVMMEKALAYPDQVPRARAAGRPVDVTVTLVAGPDRARTERTVNSFLRTCTDFARIDRYVVLDAGLSAQDRSVLSGLYPFLEFEAADADPANWLGQIRRLTTGRYWLHLRDGWRFFAPEPLVGRLIGVLEAEPDVMMVGVNFEDVATLSGRCAAESQARRSRDGSRYVLTNWMLEGPAMFDLGRADRVSGAWKPGDPVPSATLDEVLCVRQD
ncbi:MAG: glycosyltransferase [Mycobacterium sp.]|nr:MAG: glycosyltransferase [Mycobacterium sp.]